MRDAKLPLAYRDSCANLLIPLNRCRFETYYLPWKCEVGLTRTVMAVASTSAVATKLGVMRPRPGIDGQTLTQSTAREAQLREVPVRRVQEAGGQDGRAQSGQGWCEEQLEWDRATGEMYACFRPRKTFEDALDNLISPNTTGSYEHECFGAECLFGATCRFQDVAGVRGDPTPSMELSASPCASQSVQILDQPLLDDQSKHLGAVLLDND